MTHEAFLERLYVEQDRRDALDLMFRYIGDLLDDYNLRGIFQVSADNADFAAVDQLFREVDLDRLNTTMLIGFLSVPFPARHRLTEYKPLLERIHTKLSQTESPDRVKRLLQGFYH